MSTAAIVTIGNEVVSGDIANTNATWLARRLEQLGLRVRLIAAVPDEVDFVAAFLRDQALVADVVIVTGGLGGTPDDVTREAVAAAFGVAQEAVPELADDLRRRSPGRCAARSRSALGGAATAPARARSPASWPRPASVGRTSSSARTRASTPAMRGSRWSSSPATRRNSPRRRFGSSRRSRQRLGSQATARPIRQRLGNPAPIDVTPGLDDRGAAQALAGSVTAGSLSATARCTT